MSSTTSGSALDDILGDRTALRVHFGITLDSDESDLDVPSDDEWSPSGKLEVIWKIHTCVITCSYIHPHIIQQVRTVMTTMVMMMLLQTVEMASHHLLYAITSLTPVMLHCR